MSMAAACDSAAEQAYSGERAGGLECNDWNNDNREALRGPRNEGIDELQLLARLRLRPTRRVYCLSHSGRLGSLSNAYR